MTYAVRLRDDADRDLTAAALWYEMHRPGLGHEFIDEVVRKSSPAQLAATPVGKLERISRPRPWPEAAGGALVDGNCKEREVNVRRFRSAAAPVPPSTPPAARP